MEPKKRTWAEAALRYRALADLALMLGISLVLVAAAWLWIPQPLVEDSMQTELLYIQAETREGETIVWKPRSVVERQIARAIVDNMATLRKRNTLWPAAQALQGRPELYIHFRTEDTYQVVALGDSAGGKLGVSYSRDGRGLGLAAQVLQAQELEEYVWEQIYGDLL